MPKIVYFIILSLVVLTTSWPSFGADSGTDVQSIIERFDKLYRSETSYAEMEMAIVTPNWKRTLRMEAWTETLEKTFIYILSPKKDKGITTLRVDNEMWNYFPKINKVMKVPPSMMMGSWMGSDFTNDDLVKESTLLDDYHYKLIQPADARAEIHYIELTPKAQTATVWGKILLEIRKSDLLPLKQRYFDEKGKEMRIMEFTDLQEMGGRTIPAVLEMVPLNKKGHKTVIRYIKATFDEKLARDVFTLRNLQRKR